MLNLHKVKVIGDTYFLVYFYNNNYTKYDKDGIANTTGTRIGQIDNTNV